MEGKGRKGKKAKNDELYYSKPEEEVLIQHSQVHSHFPVSHNGQTSRWTLQGTVSEFKDIVVFHSSKIETIRNQMEAMTQ